MTRAFLLLALIACGAADAQSTAAKAFPRGCRDRSCMAPRSGRVVPQSVGSTCLAGPYNWSLSAPAQACACTADSRYTVTSGATYCVKGNEWSGIQPGDFVSCPANTPRWMPGGDGTGLNGLQSWKGAANTLTRSQDFSHADWNKHQVNGGTVTVTADACLAPDGTMTADMVHFTAATSGSKVAALYQQSCPIEANVRTLYVRTVNPDAGLSADDGGVLTGRFMFLKGNGSNFGGYCDHTSTGYTRCRQFDDAGTQIGAYFYFGVISDFASFAAQDVCVWQADCQNNIELLQNPWPPPIVTTTATVTRAGDAIEVNGFYFPQWSNARLTGAVLDESGASGLNNKVLMDLNDHAAAVVAGNAVSGFQLRKPINDLNVQCQKCSSVECVVAESPTQIASSADSLQCTYAGEIPFSACINGGCGDAGVDAGMSPQPNLTIGSAFNGSTYINPLNGVIKAASVTSDACKDIYLFGDAVGKNHTAPHDNLNEGYAQYPIHYTLLGNRVSIFNRGDVTGLSSAHCLSTVLDQLHYVTDAGLQARSYFLLQCGLDSAADAGGVISDDELALASAQDAGVHVMWSTVTPYFTQKTQIEAINAALRTFCTGRGITVADTYSSMEDPPGSGQLNALYDVGDTKHLSAAGYTAQTNLWVAKGVW